MTIASPFPYETGPAGIGPGNVALDPGSFTAAGPALRTEQHRLMSNALLISGKRSANGHPIFVAGPQVGYFSPEILMEEDLHGGGLDARGVAFPGLGFYLQIGRGPDYAWSATSASSDVTDQFAETLCGGDDLHYLFKGTCRAMGTFDAGTLKGLGTTPDTELTFHTTVHGPVVGYATSNGTKVAIASQRSTRGRELLAAIPFQTLTTAAVHSPQQFFQTMAGFDLTFNWFYADSKHIAMYSSGRLPLRAPGVDPGLPTNGERHVTSGAAGSRRSRIRTSSTRRAARSSTGTTSRPPASARRTTTGRTARCTACCCSTRASPRRRRTRRRASSRR